MYIVDTDDVVDEQIAALPAKALPFFAELIALEATARIRKETERLEAVLVRRARNGGVTWTEIAAVLRISKQAVHKKYGGRGLFGGRP